MNEGKATCGNPSRGRYQMGCRCLRCRAANADYERERSHGAYGKRRLVGEAETAEARRRVEGWRRRGIGLATVELWTGVHRSSLQTLLLANHPNCNGATKRLSRESYEAIMGCTGIRPAPHANVDSGKALRAVDGLLAAGWTKARISKESGVPYSTLAALTCRRRGAGRCSYATHEKLCGLWKAVSRGGAAKRKHKRLEDWQWAEARHDYQHGTEAGALAERYGVNVKMVKQHMRKRGVEFASAAALPQAGRVAEAVHGKQRMSDR